jgi:prolyl 4-hydroxylase
LHGLKDQYGDNKVTDFIGKYKCNESICDDLIEFFKQNAHGHINGLTNNKVIKDVKDSTDLCLSPYDNNEPMQNYTKFIWDCLNDYAKTYYHLQEAYKFSITESINIQKYPIGGGFKKWHYERDGSFNRSIKRILVFMTYLNDVEDGGTEFIYQKQTVKAEKTKTLIFPSDWTHTHRGQISHTKEKIIITGWFSHLWDV